MLVAKVNALFVKPERGSPMVRVSHLDLHRDDGIVAGIGPRRPSPRQICVTTTDSLARHMIIPEGARANVVLDTAEHALTSGMRISIGSTVLRVTISCEPCAHGAKLAGSPMRRFRGLSRFLAVIVKSGSASEADSAALAEGAFESAPDSFPARCGWALEKLPSGHVVTSKEFLRVIGASTSYARVLPRWLKAARTAGAPAHRVLGARFQSPTWAPDATQLLKSEGLPDASAYEAASYPLSERIWFSDRST